MKLNDEKTDKTAGKHLTSKQFYNGIPVFAGILKTHFDAAGNLIAVNGNFIPEIKVNPKPSQSAQEAGAVALGIVTDEKGAGKGLSVAATTLYIYRTGLAKGVNGLNYLAWEVEVGNGTDVREMLYIDAHTGELVDRLPGIVDGMYRRAYDGQNLPNVPPSYPASPFWSEGDVPSRRASSKPTTCLSPRKRRMITTSTPLAATHLTPLAQRWMRFSIAAILARTPRGTERSSRSARA